MSELFKPICAGGVGRAFSARDAVPPSVLSGRLFKVALPPAQVNTRTCGASAVIRAARR